MFVDNAQSLFSQSRAEAHAGAARGADARGRGREQQVGAHRGAGHGRRPETIEALESLASEGRLPLRTYEMVSDDSAALAYFYARGPQKAAVRWRVWVRGIKLYADGALGSRGAALLAPYSDDSANTGLLVSTPEHLQGARDRGASSTASR